MKSAELPPKTVEQKERPKFLYHGSPNKMIKEFEPRNETIRHSDEGHVIFAAPDRAAAAKNLFSSNDTWTAMGRVNGVDFILIAKDKREFIEKDEGGAIYELPSETFVDEPKYRGMAKREWTSNKKVVPSSKEVFPSALDAMIKQGVQVYFIDESSLEAFRKTEDKVSMLKSLTSENESRGEGIRSFDIEGQ